MEPSNWASEHSDALRDYFANRMSFSEICREINARFGTSYTRNAVIGRAKRMGLSAPKRLESPPLVPVLPGSSRSAPLQRRLPAQDRGQPPGSAFGLAEPAKLRCVGIQPRLISLLELEQGDCRYPYGGEKEGEEIAFCGHPRRPGSSYCTAHFHLTRASGTVSERFAGPVVLRLVPAV